jgi:hypothetical protein
MTARLLHLGEVDPHILSNEAFRAAFVWAFANAETIT